MAIEQKGPGGVSNSYGTRATSNNGIVPQTKENTIYGNFFPEGTTPLSVDLINKVSLAGGVYVPYQSRPTLSPGIKPVGFNAYEVVYRKLLGAPTADADRATLLNFAQECGANIVRIMLPIFAGSEYLTRVHSTPTMPEKMDDSNLRASYISAVDTFMNDCAARGMKVHISDMWNMNAIPDAFGEAYLTAYASTTTKTAIYAKSSVEWFFKRYATHPAFEVYSFGNEYRIDPTGVANPSPAQWGAWFSFLAAAARKISTAKVITANLQTPTGDVTATRPSIDDWAANMRVIYKDLDAYCFHIYQDGYNYVGRSAGNDGGSFANATFTQLGYEGLDSLMSALRAICDADGKPFILGEIGVPNDAEVDTKWSKKRRVLRGIQKYTDYGMLWNLQLHAYAGGDLLRWSIDPTGASGTTWKPLVKAANTSRQKGELVGGGTASLLLAQAPKASYRTIRVAGAFATFTTTAAHNTTTPCVAFWFRLDAAANPAETIFDLRGGDTFSGIFGLMTSDNPSYSFYLDFRAAAGSAGNTSGALPNFAVGEWHHVAIAYDTVAGNTSITIWLDGKYWRTQTAATYAPIVAGITAKIGGGTNGGIWSIQDFAIMGSMTPEDVWAHMRGEIVPHSVFHMRALPNGKLLDVSKNGVTITQGASSSVIQD